MTTSGVANWTLTGSQLIKAALLKLRAIDPMQSIDSMTLADCTVSLNAMLTAWQLDGVDIWLDQEIVVFMDANAEYYNLGPSGDEATELRGLVITQLANDAAANDTELTVDSITGFANDDNVGIILDDNTIHWDTANGAPANTEITVDTGIPSAASTDNYVFGYTNSITRPVIISEARVRNTDNDDTPLKVVSSRDEFMRHTDKTATGEVQEVYYDPLYPNGRLYVWPICGNDSITDRIILSTKRRIYDTDDPANDTMDLPDDILNAIIWNLADELQPNYGTNFQNITQRAVAYYSLIRRVYRQKGSIYLRP